MAASVISTLLPTSRSVATVTGATLSTRSSREPVPTLPAASVARASTVRTPSSSTANGPSYGAHAPPSTETSTAGAGSRLSEATTVTVGCWTYQPDVAGPGWAVTVTVGGVVSSPVSGATTNTTASAGTSVPATSPSTKNSRSGSAYSAGSTASHVTGMRLSFDASSYSAVTVAGSAGAVPASVTTLTLSTVMTSPARRRARAPCRSPARRARPTSR